MDKYITRVLKAINKAKTNEEKKTILDKIYNDGFEDGVNEAPRVLQVESHRKHS